MKNLSRLYIMLIFAFLLFIVDHGTFASGFKDSENHWAKTSIEKWNDYGVVKGDNRGFRPNDAVTRAEFSQMINNIMQYVEKEENKFSDIDSSKWYSDAMIKLNTAGVMLGKNGKAFPNDEITREEAAVVIARAFKVEKSVPSSSFKDSDKIAKWAKDYVNTLSDKKVMNGTPEGNFNPQASLSRAEAVTIFSNLIQEFVSKPGHYKEDIKGNLLVNTKDTFLRNMNISGDLFIAQGVGDGEVTLENVKITGNVYVFGGGQNSIIFNNVDVDGALVVNRYDGKVRILATGTTSVSVTKLNSGVLLVTKELTGGGFQRVEIPADIITGHQIVLDGNFNKVINQSESVEITANGSIKELVAETKTDIKGTATVDKVTAGEGVDITINEKPVQATPSTPSAGGSTPSTPSNPGNNNGDTLEPTPGGGADDDNDEPLPNTLENVLAELEKVFLKENKDVQNIISNVNLVSSLEKFPTVQIEWESSDLEVIKLDGSVTRSEKDDQFVTLTAKLSGELTGEKAFQLIVRAKGTDHVEVGDVDPYFANGHPQAYIKDGTIWVKFKLNQPAEVFMVVNAMNGDWKSSVKSVLEGHSGEDNDIIHVDEWPYFDVEDTEEIEFDTGVSIVESRPALVEFVIKDEEYISSSVTRIEFDQETVSALDTAPPKISDIYVNKNLDQIFIYFNEPIDLTSIPVTADFALNSGNITNVEAHNYEGRGGVAQSYIKLTVDSILEEQKSNLIISYMGTAIRDVSDAKNKLNPFDNKNVNVVLNKIESATISSNRESMIVRIENGLNPKDNNLDNIKDLFTIKVNGESYKPSFVDYGYSSHFFEVTLKFDASIPQGEMEVIFETKGIKNWGMDEYPAMLQSNEILEISQPGTPTAAYQPESGNLSLTFDEGFIFDNNSFSAAGFTLKIDEKEFALRGFDLWAHENILNIDLKSPYVKQIKDAIEIGANIQIKYTKLNGDARHQLTDGAGVLISDFDFVTVAKR